MADIETNVNINIDTSDALAQLKLLQQQISAFQQAMRKAGADNAAAARAMQQNLVNSVNATGKFQANIQTIQTSAERFTTALEKNKLTMGEYFRYAGGASKTFGKLFKSEFETINQVARERVKDLQTQYIKLGRDANGAMKAISVRPLALDMDNLGTKTQIAAQRQQLFNQLMKQGSTQLLNFGKNTQWAGRQLMVGFTVPLTMMGSAAAKAYMEIEKASISFKRVYGDINTTADETEKMAQNVKALANEFTKYGVAVADTMDMAAKAAAMGKTGADLLAQINQANKLAVLGQVDQNQALETTISLTNAFGTSADQLSGKIDFLNAVENQTVTSIEDLTIAIPKAAPVIKQLGGSVEDLTFFLTAMKEGGINASEGANALKSGIASMINPTKKASDFLRGFGINIKGIVEGNAGNIKQTVIDVAKAFDTLDPLNRARAIEQMFGKFQFSRISTLFQNVIKEGSQAQTVAGLAKQTAEELAVLSEREMKKISDSPMYKFQKAVQDIQAKLAPVGEAFLKAITPIMEFVGKVLDGFNNLSSGTKNFITILVTAVAGIGPLLLMTFGLLANGIANIMKLFTNIKSMINKSTRPSDILGEQTGYMNSEQLKAAAIASSLDQAHSKLRQTFTSEASAVNELTAAYRNAIQAQQQFQGVPNVPVGDPNAVPKTATPKKYANGVAMVPGPKGAGDIVPALLSPGEAVIPAKHAQKYAPVIAGMVAGNLPGFENGTTGAGMRQTVYGPLTQKQTEGLARTGGQLKQISDEVMAGPYANVPPTDFGTQISPTTGHSFPAFNVGGIYQKPDGTKVFVKPQMDLTSALAEVRGTTIARDAHGLVAPKQEIRVMMDPTDPENKRRFIVLESALDSRIADIPNTFTKDQYFTQLVASLLRGDKDLGIGNLGGNVLADVGTAGVFGRASGKRALGSAINSMEEQAIINLLGVKGGAKRFFAEATSEMVSKMTPAEYDAAMKAEIQRVAPKLQATIAGFGNMSPEEKVAYEAMQQRLQAGMGVDWGRYQVMHSAVPPKKFEDGGWVGLTQASHTQKELDKYDPAVRAQIEKLYPGLKDEHLQYITVLGNLTADLPTWVNQRLIPGKGGIVPPIFQKVWNSIQGKFNSSARAAGVPANLNDTLAQIENVVGNTTVKVAGGRNVIDPILADGTKEALFSSVSKGGDYAQVANRLIERSNTVGSIRADLGKNANGKLRELLASGIAEFAPNGKDVVFAGTKIKIGRFALSSSAKKPEQRAGEEAARASWIASGAAPEALPEQLKLRGSSMPPGSFRRSLTGISSYDELLASITSVSDPTVFDEKAFMSAQKFAEGTENVGGKPSIKPKASVFDIDDTLLDLSSFMVKHKAENDKLPEEQKKKWYKEAAKDPKGIPAAIARLKAAQERGNKILLMTARPDFYEPYTIETLEKLGIDMKGIKVIARKDKDYRKPEQMKYDKTAAFMKYYDIEEFYDDMAATRGAISLLGIPTYNPLKLASGFKVMMGDEKQGEFGTLKEANDFIISGGADEDAVVVGPNGKVSFPDLPWRKFAKGGRIPGYANGTFSVPGPKGAGDVVPAMLSPGEAVIPAKQAEQHRGLITQMIDGNLKGYANGGVIPGYRNGGIIKGYNTGGFVDGKPVRVIIVGDETVQDSPAQNVIDIQEDVAKGQKDGLEEQRATGEELRQLIKDQKERDKKEADYQKQVELEQRRVDAGYDDMTEEQKKKFDKNATGGGIAGKIGKAFTRTETTGKIQSAAYAATSIAGMASMIPENVIPGVGKAAQAAIAPIGAVTAAMQMIPGPAGVVVGALAAIGTIGFQIADHLQKVSQESQRLAEAMGTGNKAIGKFAEFAKTVSGTEVMNKQRQASAGQFFNVVEGKTTFGESYMKSDAGTQLVKDVGESIKSGGLENAKKLITTQLSTAISSGVMTPAQARSIAANLGAKLGDMSFGMEVSGKITDLVGPSGEDLAKEPLNVRLRVVEMGMENVRKQFENSAKYNAGGSEANKAAGNTVQSAAQGTVAGGVAGLALGGAAAVVAPLIAGTAAASTLTGTLIAGMAAAVPVVGLVAAGIGLVAGAVYGVVKAEEAMTKQAAMTVTAVGDQLALQQQMADSLEVSYQKRIDAARAAGDAAEATRLQNQYLVDQKALLEANAKNTQEMYDSVKSASGGFLWMGDMAGKYETVANDAIDAAFKGTGQEVQATMAKDTIGNMTTANKGQKTMLKTMVAQKQLGFNQIETANELFGSSEEGANQLEKLLVNSPTEANRTLGLAASLQGPQKKQFVIDMSLKSPEDAKAMNDALEMAQKTTGVFFGQKNVAEAVMKFAVENPEKMLEFKKNIDALKASKVIDISVVQKILGKDIAKLLKDPVIGKYFNKYSKANKAVFLTELQQIMAMEGDPDMIASWKLWNKENGQTRSFAEFAAYQADRTVTTQGEDTTGVGDGNGDGGPKAPEPSILDKYVKMLREANMWQQKLTIGWNDSYKAIMKYGTESIKQFGGIAALMQQQGADAEIIRDFMNGTEEEQNRIIDKKTGKLRKNAGELLKKLKEIKDASDFGLSYILATPAERLAKDNELYQAGLDVIAIKEKKINDKYDARIKALDQIGKIQDKNNQQQQDTLTLADALSKGDIAAAAKAALQAKQNEQKQALEDAKASLDNARKAELENIEIKINGHVEKRAGLEKIIADNSEKIANFKLLEQERQHKIATDALASSIHVAKMLKDGKALSGLKPYNPTVTGGGGTTAAPGGTTAAPGATTTPAPTSGSNSGLTQNVGSLSGIMNTQALQNTIDAVSGEKGATKVSKDYYAAKAKVKQLAAKVGVTKNGGLMSDAEAAEKFGGKDTQGYKDYTAAVAKLGTATSTATNWGLMVDGKVLTASQIDTAYTDYNSNYNAIVGSQGKKDAYEAAKAEMSPAVLDRAKYIHNADTAFRKDQTKLSNMRAKIETAKGKFTGLAAGHKNKSIYWLKETYDNTPESMKKDTGWQQLIEAGAEPEAYIKHGAYMVKRFENTDKYRQELRNAGYTDTKLSLANLFDDVTGTDGEQLATIDDFKNNQMYSADASGKRTRGNKPDMNNMANFVSKHYAKGGMVYANNGLEIAASKYALGTDTIPAMLTAGEFVMSKPAVDRIGSEALSAMNNGTSPGESVYNYSITVNANSSDANGIADAVLREIRRIDSQRIRSSSI